VLKFPHPALLPSLALPLVFAMWNLPALHAQSSDNPRTFEVATIKPSNDPGVHLYLDESGVFHPTGTRLADLIKLAYDLHSRQIVGGPSWLDRDKFDLFAKPDRPGKPPLAELKIMLQRLLADRFQLALHREKRELPVYAITVAKSGAKITRNDKDPNGSFSFGAGPRVITVTNGTIADLANVLQNSGNIVDRPVVDQTGLGSARYDLTAKWTPLASPPDGADAPPEFFTAFQQQLGLKLESTKALIDVMVIDRAEKPSQN
jgi:uncharacterized protein (TIGR03435 family)